MMNDTTRQLAYHILETGKRMRDRVQAAQARCMKSRNMSQRYGELTQSQLETIRMIRKNGPSHLNELAQGLGISSPSASNMVDRLVDKGILLRTSSPSDRRKIVIEISQHALDDIEAIEQAIVSAFMDLVEKIGPDTSRLWMEVLEKVSQALES